MSFGLGRGRTLDPAPGLVGVSPAELPPLPDGILADPRAGLVDPRRWFPHADRPLEIEIGSGKGTFLLTHAAAFPGVNLLGIEWAREFYEYTADRCRRAGAANVRVLQADATEFLHWRCPDSIASVLHLYFSDPWPKARHHRRRVVSDRFLADAARVLVPGGELRVATDHAEYWAWMLEHFARHAGVFDQLPFTAAAHPAPDGQSGGPTDAQPDGPADGPTDGPTEDGEAAELIGTNFERKYRLERRPIHACILRRRRQV